MNNETPLTETELELIDRYLAGELSTGEKETFEQRLHDDESWAKNVEEIKLIGIGIQEVELRNTIAGMRNSSSAKQPAVVRKMTWQRRLAVAAVLITMFSTLSWLLFFRASQNEKLYATFYKPDAGLATEMGVSDHYQFERAMVDYKRGEYKQAINEWSDLLKQSPANDTLQYFIASAQLAAKNKTAAIEGFNSVISQSQSAFKEDAYWYKGLILLSENKKQEAIENIELSAHPQKDALLVKLKK